MQVNSGVKASKLNILIYADPGDGKTYLAGTALDVPSLGEVLFLDIDGGLAAVAHHGDKIKHVSIGSSAEYEAAIKDLAGPDKAKYGTVVVDSTTELSELELQAVAKAATEKGGRRDNPDQTELVDFKLRSQKILRLLGLTKRLSQNIIFLAKAGREVPKDGNGLPIAGAKPTEIYPDLPKKVRAELIGMVDIVGFLHKEADGTHKLYVENHGPIKGKSRIKGVSGILTNPTMKDIFNPKGATK